MTSPDETRTRLTQWCQLVSDRYREIATRYRKAGLPFSGSYEFQVDSVGHIQFNGVDGYESVRVYLGNGGIYALHQAVCERMIPPEALEMIRITVMTLLDKLDAGFNPAFEEMKRKHAEYDQKVEIQLKGFTDDLASDALQKGKIVPP